MARVNHPTRSFEQIFKQAGIAGADNVILNEAEVGIVLTGGGPPLSAGTVANRRWKDRFNAPHLRGANNQVVYRLSDVLAERDRQFKRSA